VVTPIGAEFYQDLRQADIANVSDESKIPGRSPRSG